MAGATLPPRPAADNAATLSSPYFAAVDLAVEFDTLRGMARKKSKGIPASTDYRAIIVLLMVRKILGKQIARRLV